MEGGGGGRMNAILHTKSVKAGFYSGNSTDHFVHYREVVLSWVLPLYRLVLQKTSFCFIHADHSCVLQRAEELVLYMDFNVTVL